MNLSIYSSEQAGPLYENRALMANRFFPRMAQMMRCNLLPSKMVFFGVMGMYCHHEARKSHRSLGVARRYGGSYFLALSFPFVKKGREQTFSCLFPPSYLCCGGNRVVSDFVTGRTIALIDLLVKYYFSISCHRDDKARKLTRIDRMRKLFKVNLEIPCNKFAGVAGELPPGATAVYKTDVYALVAVIFLLVTQNRG